MEIMLNGKKLVLKPGATVADMVTQLGLDTRKIAVERNCEIVSRPLYSETSLNEGDAVEIVRFIGGG